jgi:thioredoxin-dependent peroxiredoxin
MTIGRNFDEVLRVIDSLQLTATHKVATPVNWKRGDDVIIAGSVSDEEARQRYPQGWKARRGLTSVSSRAGLMLRYRRGRGGNSLRRGCRYQPGSPRHA